jgi:hypothetical protein
VRSMRRAKQKGVRDLTTLFVVLSLLLACSESSDDSSSVAVVQFDQVKDEILLRTCTFSDCHSAGAGDLLIDDEGLYEALVDAPATVEGEVLVRPFDADGSYLIMKLEGAVGIQGDQMPPNAAISQDTIDRIRSWIDAGAER